MSTSGVVLVEENEEPDRSGVLVIKDRSAVMEDDPASHQVPVVEGTTKIVEAVSTGVEAADQREQLEEK